MWNDKYQKYFDNWKLTHAKKSFWKKIDLWKKITLITDTSEHSISGILSQDAHPIIYLWIKFTFAECNYSNIEKKTLAIVWMTTCARQFLIENKFILSSDYRQYEFIFNPRKELPKDTTSRILKWAIMLMAFDFDIQYVKGI